jgi:hypothetical protein
MPCRVLRDVLKATAKYAKLSRLMALIRAGDREMDIARLEGPLGDVQRTFLVGRSELGS